ncbi:hypothetical protein JTB14_030980 [Gonioctena quinquepunctata]|nr:hypothetical protein JTB14_030980 [Gonioctena quinquepunctata]
MEQKQKEIDNSMRILEMEQDLKNTVLDEQDEEGSYSIHSKVYENVFLADEALEGTQREKSVTEWVDNIPQDEPHDIPKGDNKTKVQNFTEIKMLCGTLTNVVNSVPSGSYHNKSPKILARHATFSRTVYKHMPYM